MSTMMADGGMSVLHLECLGETREHAVGSNWLPHLDFT